MASNFLLEPCRSNRACVGIQRISVSDRILHIATPVSKYDPWKADQTPWNTQKWTSVTPQTPERWWWSRGSNAPMSPCSGARDTGCRNSGDWGFTFLHSIHLYSSLFISINLSSPFSNIWSTGSTKTSALLSFSALWASWTWILQDLTGSCRSRQLQGSFVSMKAFLFAVFGTLANAAPADEEVPALVEMMPFHMSNSRHNSYHFSRMFFFW